MILEEVQKQGIDQYATFDNLDGEEENLVILIFLTTHILSHSVLSRFDSFLITTCFCSLIVVTKSF